MVAVALALLKEAAEWVGKILRAIPPWAWIAFAALFAAYVYGEARADQREAEVRAEYELRSMKEAEQAQRLFAELEADHRKREAALSAEIIQADARHAQALKDAEARANRTVADLRDGNVKLRQHWQACLSKPVPKSGPAADDTARADEGADLRAADIGRIQRVGGSCDADVKWWQDTWKAAEKAVNNQ